MAYGNSFGGLDKYAKRFKKMKTIYYESDYARLAIEVVEKFKVRANPNPVREQKCRNCGKIFKPLNNSIMNCSRSCGQASRRSKFDKR